MPTDTSNTQVRWGILDGCALGAITLALFSVGYTEYIGWGPTSAWHGQMPMSAVSALFIIGLASSLVLNRHRPQWSLSRWLGWSTVVGILLFSFWYGIRTYFGLTWDVWLFQLLLAPATALADSPFPPLVAINYVLLALAFALDQPPCRGYKMCRHLSGGIPLIPWCLSLTVLVSYIAGTPLLYDAHNIPMALLTAVAISLLSFGMIIGGRSQLWPAALFRMIGLVPKEAPADAAARPGPVGVLLTLYLIIGTVGVFYLKSQIVENHRSASQELTTIAELKVDQITQWVSERRGDTTALLHNQLFIQQAQTYLNQPPGVADNATADALHAAMQVLRLDYDYQAIILLDARGQARMAIPAGTEALHDEWLQYLTLALTARGVVDMDLHRETLSSNLHMASLVPIGIKAAPGTAADGVLVFVINPEQVLFPMVQNWPTGSRSAETLLVRREGPEAVLINPLRHSSLPPLSLRFPITPTSEIPAVQAVLGKTGIYEGLDYRGIPVLAVLKALPGTQWSMVAKIDLEEVYAPLRQRVWNNALLVLSLLVALTMAASLWARQHEIQLLQHEYQAQREKLASERRFAALFEQAAVGVAEVDSLTGQYIHVNQRFAAMFGYTVAEMEQTTYQEHTHPDDQQIAAQRMQQLLDGTIREYMVEKRYLRKDGSVLWGSLSVSALWQPQDTWRRHVVVLQDITERKIAQEHIQQYADIVTNMQQGLCVYHLENPADDRSLRMVAANPASTVELGMNTALTMGRYIDVCFPNLRAQGIPQKFAQVVCTQQPIAFESLTYSDQNIHESTFAVKAFPIPGQRVAVLFEDITEEKRIQAALQRQEEFIRTLLDNLAEGVVACDAQGQLVLFNRTARQWHGTDVRAIPNTEWANYFGLYAEDGVTLLQPHEIPLVRAFAGETIHSAMMAIVAVGQEPRVVVAEGGPFFDAQQRKLGAVMVMRDVTESRRAEAEIRQLNAELEARVRRRTAQLQVSNQELEAFSYSVSHDLRAPLRGIDGWSQALLEDCGAQLDATGQQYLARVRAETQRLGRLIDDLLQLARVSRADMHWESVDLSVLAQTVAGRIQALAPERQMVIQIEPNLQVRGDPRLLEVVLTNLLDNAVKFTGKQPDPRIEFGCLTAPQADNTDDAPVYFIRDNGAGFDIAYAQKLFGAFQRMHKTADFPGTGIGLATVQRIIHRHGGRIWAEAQVNQGATFYFTLGNKYEL